jgi:hypothetical protein
VRLKLLFLGGCVLCLALTLAGSSAFANNIAVQNNVVARNNAVIPNNAVLSEPPAPTPESSSLALMGLGLIGFSVLGMLLRSKSPKRLQPGLSPACDSGAANFTS